MSHNSTPRAETALAITRPTAAPAQWRLARSLVVALALVGVLACSENETGNEIGPLRLRIQPEVPTTTLLDLEGNVSIQHPTGMTPTFVWSWERNDVVEPLQTTRSVASTDTTKNETWRVTVFADFGSSTSESASATFTVINSPPTMIPAIPLIVERICSAGDSAQIGNSCSFDFQCGFASGICGGAPNDVPLTTDAVTTADDDNDVVTVRYQWFVNSVMGPTTAALDPSFTAPGDIVFVEITPNDGQDDGETGASSSVEIQPSLVAVSGDDPPAPDSAVANSFPSTGARASTSISTSTSTSPSETLAGIPSGSLSSETLTEYTTSGRVAISISEANVCNITADGSLECTGAQNTGLTQPPPGSYSRVAVEVDYACAIRSDDQSIRCWGKPPEELGLLSPPEGPFIQIGLGIEAACGLSDVGEIACWGDDLDGRASPPEGQFVYLDVSDTYSCAIAGNGLVSCWGPVENDN